MRNRSRIKSVLKVLVLAHVSEAGGFDKGSEKRHQAALKAWDKRKRNKAPIPEVPPKSTGKKAGGEFTWDDITNDQLATDNLRTALTRFNIMSAEVASTFKMQDRAMALDRMNQVGRVLARIGNESEICREVFNNTPLKRLKIYYEDTLGFGARGMHHAGEHIKLGAYRVRKGEDPKKLHYNGDANFGKHHGISTCFEDVARHEIGHHVWYAMPAQLRQSFEGMYHRVPQKDWKKISRYAGEGEMTEGFAEAFCAVTHSNYKNQPMPKDIDDWFKKNWR